MPKVSIILPTYNVEQYLKECLDSVVGQTLKDIEIICVNDGSTDNSLEIINNYAARDERIKVINKTNTGYGDSMNRGLDAATGEYIGIVEPDDWIKTDMYETLYQIAKEKDLDLIKSDFYRFTGTGKKQKLFYNKLDGSDQYYNKVLNTKEDITPFKFIMNTWCGIYKRSFLNEHNIRHHTTPGASFQDNGFWFQTFVYADKMYFLNQPFYMNRRDNPNSSVKNKGKVYAMTNEYNYIRGIIEKDNKLWENLKGIYWYKRFINYCFTLSRIDSSLKKEYVGVFADEIKEAIANNELDESLFTEQEKDFIDLLLNKPQVLLKKNIIIKTYKLFSVIPVLQTRARNNKKVYKILGLPLIKNKKSATDSTSKYYFCGLPLFKVTKKQS